MTRVLESSCTDLSQAHPKLKQSLLLMNHTAAAIARPTIAHAQLRHLLVCPQRRGIVYFISDTAIVERNLFSPHAPPRKIIEYDFKPTCFAATAVASNSNALVFAVGGSRSQLHVSLHSFSPPTTLPQPTYTPPKLIWKHDATPTDEIEIVNTIIFTPTLLTDDSRRAESELRLAVSGNNATVRFFDIALQPHVRDDQRLQLCGQVVLETFINHLSISPNGRTLLCAGDTPKAYLYHITPGQSITLSHITTYILPPPPPPPPPSLSSTLTPASNIHSVACFSTAWSPDGFKFAVASQEGQLCVWDVRSSAPIFTFWTTFRPNTYWKDRGWENVGLFHPIGPDDNAPDSGIRSVEFTGGPGGRELLLWVEHTINLHVVDARTFDLATHIIIPFPDLTYLMPSLPSTPSSPVEAASPSSTHEPRTPSPPIQSRSPPIRRQQRSVSPVMAADNTASPPIWTDSRSVSPVERPRSVGQQADTSSSSSPPPLLQPIPADPAVTRSQPILTTQSPTPHPPDLASITPNDPPRLALPRTATLEAQGEAQLFPIPEGDEEPEATNLTVLGRITREIRELARLRPEDMQGWNSAGDEGQRQVVLRAIQAILEGPEVGVEAEVQAVQAQLRRVLNVRPVRRGPREREQLGSEVAQSGEEQVHIAGLCLDPTKGWVYVSGQNGIVEWRVREREEGKGGGVGGWV